MYVKVSVRTTWEACRLIAQRGTEGCHMPKPLDRQHKPFASEWHPSYIRMDGCQWVARAYARLITVTSIATQCTLARMLARTLAFWR